MTIDHTQLDDRELDAALRELDVADLTLTAQEQARKESLLSSLLDQQSSSSSTEVTELLGRRRRRTVRWLIPAAAAGLVGVFLVTGGPGDNPAYASWTPDPQPLSGDMSAKVERACKSAMAETKSRHADVPPDVRPTTKPETAKTVVAEKRGNYIFLAMAAEDGSTAECFLAADDPSRVQAMTGSSSTSQTPPAKALRAGEFEGNGAGMSSGPEGTYAFTQGRVGPEVTGVMIRSEGRTVQATVLGGHYAAWWPSTPFTGPSATPVVSYDVRLADGSVRTEVSAADQPERQAPGPRQIGLVERGGMSSQSGEYATAAGRVGSQVVGVTINVNGQKVVATVKDGAFSAQWPHASTGELPAVTYDLTLTDGSTLTGQQPVSGAE